MQIEDYAKWKDFTITDEEWDALINSPANALENCTEQEIREYQLREIAEEDYQKQLLKEHLKNIGVTKYISTLTKDDIVNKWKEHFCPLPSRERQKAYYMEEHLWHAFTYNLISAWSEGKEAKEQFERVRKNDVYIFFEDEEDVYHVNMPDSVKSCTFRLLYYEDVFFVDGNFEWTFVFTHEGKAIWYSL